MKCPGQRENQLIRIIRMRKQKFNITFSNSIRKQTNVKFYLTPHLITSSTSPCHASLKEAQFGCVGRSLVAIARIGAIDLDSFKLRLSKILNWLAVLPELAS